MKKPFENYILGEIISEKKKLVFEDSNVVIFEGGFWIRKESLDAARKLIDKGGKVGFNTNKNSKELTWYILPKKITI